MNESQINKLQFELENNKLMQPIELSTATQQLENLKAQQVEYEKHAKFYEAEALFRKNGSLTPQIALRSFTTAAGGLDKNVAAKKEIFDKATSTWSKMQSWQNQYNKAGTGITNQILKTLDPKYNSMQDFNADLEAAKKAYDTSMQSYTQAISAKNGFMMRQSDIIGGKTSLSQATIDAYKMAGSDIPAEVVDGFASQAPASNPLDDEIMNLIMGK